MINKKESIELKIFKELSKFNLQTYHTIDNMPRLLKNEFTLFIHFFIIIDENVNLSCLKGVNMLMCM